MRPSTAPLLLDILVIGHESFGQVEAVGSNVTEVRPGDYVVATVRRPGVALDWMLDVVFSKDLVQVRTLRAPTMSQAENEPRSPAAPVSHVCEG